MYTASKSASNKFWLWFLAGHRDSVSKPAHLHQSSWWQVMCLTGVDYFSSLGYAPGIAFLAAGILSPVATVVLVLLNLCGALPIYSKVAHESPNGQGSIAMLERLLPGWKGKTLVLVLLGFACTDFIITITLSAADAAAHAVENPWMPACLHSKMLLTLILLFALGAVFLKGFREAIDIAVILVIIYLGLNSAVVVVAGQHLILAPECLKHWWSTLSYQFQSPVNMIVASILVFPKLALGMSGFETGVAVMPLVKGAPGDTPQNPLGRIRHTRYLLRTAAIIMGFFLLVSSLTTTTLIPAAEFLPSGAANGRALAYLAHKYLGDTFGAFYDVSSICILWFAGASAMAGLLNLVPRYLPRYGMAPLWAGASRPLVAFFTVVALAVTIIFNADVDAQGGAYATGVLVLMTSAAFASALVVWQKSLIQRIFFTVITAVFIYTTIANCIERPEGIHIAMFFIVSIMVISLISRAMRSTELRVACITLDKTAEAILAPTKQNAIRIVASRPGTYASYAQKEAQAREAHNLPSERLIFLEVSISDASKFTDDVLEVRGSIEGPYQILRCESSAVPNAIAALMLYIRDYTKQIPHLYVGWTEGNPVIYILKYLFFGEGETAPVTREILREAEPNPALRPRVHVG